MSNSTKIEAQRWYSLTEITQQEMFPWIPATYWSVRRLVMAERNRRLLKPVTRGKDNNVRYQFKGANIIKFIQAVEAGKVRL